MALLLTVLILAALTSIASGIFAAVFGEIRISGEVGDSFTAFYAADQGIERLLYCDRVPGSGCKPPANYGPVTFDASSAVLPQGVCMTLTFVRRISATIRSVGEYRCGSTNAVKRTAAVSY